MKELFTAYLLKSKESNFIQELMTSYLINKGSKLPLENGNEFSAATEKDRKKKTYLM